MFQLRRLTAIVAIGAVAHTGAIYAFQRQRRRHAGERRHILVTQGGQRLRLSISEVADAVVSVLMGGVVLDLRGERLRPSQARIEVLIVMGGVQLLVPENWKVSVDVEALMGGVEDRCTSDISENHVPDLVISGRVIMGGIDILRRSN